MPLNRIAECTAGKSVGGTHLSRRGRRCVDDFHRGDEYWRGWLARVQAVFAAVREELDPIGLTPPSSTLQRIVDIDLDEIPF